MIIERSKTLIKTQNYKHNVEALMNLCHKGMCFMQIVKADAYGHGATEIAKLAIELGCTSLGVANAAEGVILRSAGIKADIILLSPSLINEIDTIIEYDLIPAIGNDIDFLNALNAKASKKIKVHINIDTGMHRAGLNHKKAVDFINNFACNNLEIEGVFTHFSASEADKEFSLNQIKKFDDVIKKLKQKPKYIHVANSGGVIAGLNSQYANLVRLGIASFGVYTNKNQVQKISLKAVMEFKSVVSSINYAEAGSFIGYNQTYKVNKNTKYAILPIGYADGYDFMLSNKAKVFINNKLCDVVGRISMDMTAIDVTDIDKIKIGDEALLISDIKSETRAENIVKSFGGSAYELLCQVGRRAKRFYSNQGKNYQVQPLSTREFIASHYSNDKLNNVIETAIEQRMNASELSQIIYSEVLKNMFVQADKDIAYRKNFEHVIRFFDSETSEYFEVETEIYYKKVLKTPEFIVACANNPLELQKYFLNPKIEYRWLLESNFELNTNSFEVTSVKVNEHNLNINAQNNGKVLSFKCKLDLLQNLVGKEVNYTIKTKTLYPKNSHQLAVYINEITKGVQVRFEYPKSIKKVEVNPIFAGKNRYPKLSYNNNAVTVLLEKNEWVFPQSGIVFSY